MTLSFNRVYADLKILKLNNSLETLKIACRFLFYLNDLEFRVPVYFLYNYNCANLIVKLQGYISTNLHLTK